MCVHRRRDPDGVDEHVLPAVLSLSGVRLAPVALVSLPLAPASDVTLHHTALDLDVLEGRR